MKNKLNLAAIIVAFVLGVVLHAETGGQARLVDTLIETCEKELPRNEFCKLTAEPVNNEQ